VIKVQLGLKQLRCNLTHYVYTVLNSVLKASRHREPSRKLLSKSVHFTKPERLKVNLFYLLFPKPLRVNNFEIYLSTKLSARCCSHLKG